MEKYIGQRGLCFCYFDGPFKSFYTFNRNLLIAKLGAYGFERDSLSSMKSYLNDRQQRVHVNNNFSFWEKVIAGVLQGSISLSMIFFFLSQVLV